MASASDQFDLFVLRRLNNPGHSGRGKRGKEQRIHMEITLRPRTILALRKTVPIGRGLYGSSTIELATRLLLSLVGEVDPDDIGTQLAYAVRDRERMVEKLERITDVIRIKMADAEAEAVARSN